VNAVQDKANRRLGVILGSVAAAFFIGFVVRIALLSGQFS
jgi:hypothetical protein